MRGWFSRCTSDVLKIFFPQKSTSARSIKPELKETPIEQAPPGFSFRGREGWPLCPIFFSPSTINPEKMSSRHCCVIAPGVKLDNLANSAREIGPYLRINSSSNR
ncbi:Uncharacterised protein [Providencia stuartii]|nr:Uncharacterised protein [Providencia stuartii]